MSSLVPLLQVLTAVSLPTVAYVFNTKTPRNVEGLVAFQALCIVPSFKEPIYTIKFTIQNKVNETILTVIVRGDGGSNHVTVYNEKSTISVKETIEDFAPQDMRGEPVVNLLIGYLQKLAMVTVLGLAHTCVPTAYTASDVVWVNITINGQTGTLCDPFQCNRDQTPHLEF